MDITRGETPMLVAAFQGALRGRGLSPHHGDIEGALDRAVAAGSAAWPGIPLDRGAFVAHIAAHIPEGADPLTALEGAHIADLYLACACLSGDEAALGALETRYLAAVDPFVCRVDGSPSFIDEVRQVLRDNLLVPREGASPKLAGYSGRGPLTAWIGVAAHRAAISLRRSDAARERAISSAVADDLPLGSDPELEYLKARYRAEFRDAVERSVASLGERDRLVLRLSVVKGVSHDKIAVMYGVHQSTVTRWLARVREDLTKDAERRLRERLRVSESELHSLAAVLLSEIDLSLSRWLDEA